MAVTIAIVKRTVDGGKRTVVFDVTGPASYTNPGGELLTAAQQGQLMPEAGLPAAVAFSAAPFFESEVEPANLRAVVLDRTNNKMLFTVAGAQVANATNLSAVTIRCRIEYLFTAVA